MNFRFLFSGYLCAATSRPPHQYPNFSASTVDGAEFRSSLSGSPFCVGSSPLEENPKFLVSTVDGRIVRRKLFSSVHLHFAGGTLEVDRRRRSLSASKLFGLFRIVLRGCRSRLLNYLSSLDVHRIERGSSVAVCVYKQKRTSASEP